MYISRALSGRLHNEINLRIIYIQSRDASRPFVEIAKELEISDATVHMRVRRLVAAGIILEFTIAMDSRLLSYNHLAFMGISIKEGSADEVAALLSNLDEILETHEMHGRYDVPLKIRPKSLDELRDIVVNKIRKLPQITEAYLTTVLKPIKEEQSVPLKNNISDAGGAAT